MNNSDSLPIVFCLSSLLIIGLLIWLFTYLIKKGQDEAQLLETEHMMILQSLPQDKQMIFSMQYNNVKKNPSTAILLALFLGGIGAHRFYLNQSGTGIIYLLFCWTGIPSIVALFDAFGLSNTVNRYNLQKAREISMMVGNRPY